MPQKTQAVRESGALQKSPSGKRQLQLINQHVNIEQLKQILHSPKPGQQLTFKTRNNARTTKPERISIADRTQLAKIEMLMKTNKFVTKP
jgi:hypothetical protein